MRPPSPFQQTNFSPGDRVLVVDGTFVGQRSLVLSLEEARSLWGEKGGQEPPARPTPGIVCVALAVFSRTVPVCFQAFQLSKDSGHE